MNWKYFLVGVGTGLAGAYAVKEVVTRKDISPENVLEKAKDAFKKAGPISGSWINMNPENYSRPPIEYKIYRGGISRNLDGVLEQFEFVADAASGTILETNKLT
jgi:predicted small secreted protein